MKGAREWRVPLAAAAMAVIAQQAAVRHSDWIFPGMREGRPIYSGAMLALLREMGCSVTVHGFRSSFAVWAEEKTAFAEAIREMALAHSVGSAVEQAYRRSELLDLRRALAEEWARFCALKIKFNVLGKAHKSDSMHRCNNWYPLNEN